jgi:hypothetical protein
MEFQKFLQFKYVAATRVLFNNIPQTKGIKSLKFTNIEVFKNVIKITHNVLIKKKLCELFFSVVCVDQIRERKVYCCDNYFALYKQN